MIKRGLAEGQNWPDYLKDAGRESSNTWRRVAPHTGWSTRALGVTSPAAYSSPASRVPLGAFVKVPPPLGQAWGCGARPGESRRRMTACLAPPPDFSHARLSSVRHAVCKLLIVGSSPEGSGNTVSSWNPTSWHFKRLKPEKNKTKPTRQLVRFLGGPEKKSFLQRPGSSSSHSEPASYDWQLTDGL